MCTNVTNSLVTNVITNVNKMANKTMTPSGVAFLKWVIKTGVDCTVTSPKLNTSHQTLLSSAKVNVKYADYPHGNAPYYNFIVAKYSAKYREHLRRVRKATPIKNSNK
jgi:hypothetical protein